MSTIRSAALCRRHCEPMARSEDIRIDAGNTVAPILIDILMKFWAVSDGPIVIVIVIIERCYAMHDDESRLKRSASSHLVQCCNNLYSAVRVFEST